jgi:hypothetical protein
MENNIAHPYDYPMGECFELMFPLAVTGGSSATGQQIEILKEET